MWKRIVWDVICLALVFSAPWWVTLIVAIGGVILFPWYIEIIFIGALYDSLYGGIGLVWYKHLVHTAIFTVPLLIGEYIKTTINL